MTKAEKLARIEELKKRIIEAAEKLKFDDETVQLIVECTRLAKEVAEGRYEDEN